MYADSAASREIHSRVRGGTVNDDRVRNDLLTAVDQYYCRPPGWRWKQH